MALKEKKTSKAKTKGKKIQKDVKSEATTNALLSALQSIVGDEGRVFEGESIRELSKQRAPTYLASLDFLLGGGVPMGVMYELFGGEGSTKSTLSYHICVAHKRQLETENKCVIVNAEREFNPDRQDQLRNDPENNFIVINAIRGVVNLKAAKAAIENNSPCTVIDSVPALMPDEDLGKELEQDSMATRARLLTKALPELVEASDRMGRSLIFINQNRANLKATSSFQSQTTQGGGKALKYLVSFCIDLVRIGPIKIGEKEVGKQIQLTFKKSRFCAERSKIVLPFYYDEGYSKEADLINVAIEHKVMKKGGAWISYTVDGVDRFKVQGLEKARLELKNNPELFMEIYGKTKEAYMNKDIVADFIEKNEKKSDSVEIVAS